MLIDLATQLPPQHLDVDLCIVGGGPAGLCIAAEHLADRTSVAVLESGFVEPDGATQLLNLGWARGPILRGHPFYLASSRLRLLGGSQNGWGGWCTPMLALDVQRRDWVEASGWPITIEQLAPYLQRAAHMCGVHPSIADPPAERGVLGDELTERRYGFAAGRRTTAQLLERPLADARTISVYLGASVTDLDCDGARTRVRAIQARTLAGAAFTVTARNFVLAAGGVENARLLLVHRLGNDSDLVGRYFMEHPHVVIGRAVLPGRSRWDRYREQMDPRLGHGVMSALGLSAAAQREHRLLNATVQLLPDQADDAASEHDDARVWLVLRAEQCPNPDSRVTLGDDLDPFGSPIAELDWQLRPLDWHSVCVTAERVAAGLERHAGARVELLVSRDTPWPSQAAPAEHYHPWGCHHLGTTRMSADRRSGVVDLDTRVHGMDNLYIAGSSLFPTGGYANPTLTLTALALRTADHLRRTV